MNKSNNKVFYGWWIVLGSILVTATVVPSVMSMANKFLIPITEDLRISRSAFSLSNSILQGMGILFSPFITKKLAKGNMKKIQSISIILFALVFASYSLATKPIHFYISSVILGICYLHTSMIPISMMITNWFDKKRGLAMSLSMSGIGFGGFIFSPLVTSWISNFGWRNAYLIFAVVILVVSLPMALFVFKKSPEEKGLKPYGYGEDSNKKSNTINESTIELSLTSKEMLLKPFFILLIVASACNGLINTGALSQFPPALEDLHGAVKAGQIISIYSIIGVFGKLLLGWLSDKFGVMKSIFFGCICFGLTFVAMIFAKNMTATYLMALVFGLAMGVGNVIPPLITSAICGPKKYGEIYGYVNSTTQLGLTFGSIVVASIYDKTGSYNNAWIVMIALVVVTLISWLLSYNRSLKYRIKNN